MRVVADGSAMLDTYKKDSLYFITLSAFPKKKSKYTDYEKNIEFLNKFLP